MAFDKKIKSLQSKGNKVVSNSTQKIKLLPTPNLLIL